MFRRGWMVVGARVLALVLVAGGLAGLDPSMAAASTGAAGTFVSLPPARVLDTRTGNGASGPVTGYTTVSVQVAGRGGVPSSGVSAVVMNVTETAATAGGYLTVFPDGTSEPSASNLNYPAGDTRANLVVVKLGADGMVAFSSHNSGSVQLIADVSGYYLGGPADTTPPGPVSNLQATPGSGSVALSWTNPTSSDFAGVSIRRAVGTTAPSSPTDGTSVMMTTTGTTSYTDNSVNSGTTYTYALFAFDNSYNYSSAVTTTTTTPAVPFTVTTTPSIDNSTRQGALDAYYDYYLPAIAVPSGSTANVSTCDPGTTSVDAQNATLTTENYFRSMLGLNPVVMSSSWSSGDQSAALMMYANGTITHYPPTTWACYTSAGADAASKSNLALATPEMSPGDAVAAYIDDHGNESDLGHRRWMIDPGLTQIGFGQVDGSKGSFNAIQVTTGYLTGAPAGSPAYVPWPAAGYVPEALEPIKNTWSVSASDLAVDMSTATVSVTSGGSPVSVTITHLPNGYGKPTVEFTLSSGYTGTADKAYTVTVSGMTKNGSTLPPFSYTTILFDQG